MPKGIKGFQKGNNYGNFLKGQIPWNKGMVGQIKGWKHTNMTKNKISLSRKGRFCLDKHPNWKGGISKMQHYGRDNKRKKLEKMAGRKMSEFCEICGRSDIRIHFDHNHNTGEFRGWICSNCNTAIGLLNEDETIMTKIINYLNK